MASIFSRLLHRKPQAPSERVDRAERAFADKRYAESAVLFRELAETGNFYAQFRLAQCYERGQGVVQSFVDAVQWFRAAAEQGSVPAQSRLGEIYLTGLEPPATASAAAIARLEGLGNQDSLLNRLYPKGLAVRRDPEQAAIWNTPPPRARMPTRRRGSGTNTPVVLGLVVT